MQVLDFGIGLKRYPRGYPFIIVRCRRSGPMKSATRSLLYIL
jgi:hypothetical protein